MELVRHLPSAACLSLLLVLMAGCSTHRSRAAIRPDAGSAGGSWNAVFAEPDVHRVLRPLPPEARAEFYRNDHTLGIRRPSVATASDQWSQPARPTLRNARRIHLDSRADSLLFFSAGRGWYRADRDVRR